MPVKEHLDPKDLRMDTYRTGGGWSTLENGVRYTHIPTGLSVSEHVDRSIHRNKVNALEKLTKLVLNSGPREMVKTMGLKEVVRLAKLAAKLDDITMDLLTCGEAYLLVKRCGMVVDFTEKRVMKRFDDGSIIMMYWEKEDGEMLAFLHVAAEIQLKAQDQEEIANLQARIAQLEGMQQR